MRDDDPPMIEDDEARKSAIELLMRTDRPRYFRDEAVQREYLQILEREEARQQGSERKLLAPGADVSIPVKRSTVGQQRRNRVGALTGTQSEVQAGRDPAVDQNLLSFDPVDLLYLDAADSERINDSRVLSDVTPDSDWTPGAQYAQRKRPPATGTVHEEDGRQHYRDGGHHEMPEGVDKKWNLHPETARVFRQSTTGRNRLTYRETPDGPPIGNIWNPLHEAYSDPTALSRWARPNAGCISSGRAARATARFSVTSPSAMRRWPPTEMPWTTWPLPPRRLLPLPAYPT